jgi:hypothetical protein
MGNSFMKVRIRNLKFVLGLCFLFGCGQNRSSQINTKPVDSMIVKPNYFSTTSLTGEERKLRTNEYLKALKVPTLEHLPLVEDFNDARFRNDREVAERCVVLYGIIFVVHGEASGDEMIRYFKEFGLWDNVSPNEKKFLTNKTPNDQEKVECSWKIEGLNVLLWSLNKFEDLGLPINMCDFEHIEDLPDLSVDPTEWIEKSKLRNREEILNEVDLIYRIHWATRDSELNGKSIPGDFHSGIVFERHYALNWLVIYADDWDDITTDT